ncbi:hypothetical protein [Nostoc sp. DedQUE12b]|nr:hypothetical protein [Nostoc sp. DedQUE12b]
MTFVVNDCLRHAMRSHYIFLHLLSLKSIILLLFNSVIASQSALQQ